MAQVKRENASPLVDHVTVTLQKEDYYPAYEKSLKKYSKQANIPGFRKGMVPTGVIKKMYGNSVFSEEVLRAAEKEINAYLEKEKPAIFGQPMPTEDNNDMVRSFNQFKPQEYAFTFEMGLQPAVVPAPLKKASIARKNVVVTNEMLEEEIDRLQKRYGNLKEPETIEGDDCVLNVILQEVDAEGKDLENGLNHETNSLLVSYFSETVRPQWMGLKLNDSLTFTLGEAFEDKEYSWICEDLKLDEDISKERRFTFTIGKIGLLEKRELDTEFFNQIFPGKAIGTETEFGEALKADLQAHWKNQGRAKVQDEIYHYLINNTDLEFPEDFLKRWMQQDREKPKTAEEVEAEFPSFKNQLKWTLISDYFINKQNITVMPEELRNYAKIQMMSYMGVTTLDESNAWLDSYVERMMKDKKYIDENYHRLLTEKLFTWTEGQVQYKEEQVSVDEFNASQPHHHH
jgi:trigger factor